MSFQLEIHFLQAGSANTDLEFAHILSITFALRKKQIKDHM